MQVGPTRVPEACGVSLVLIFLLLWPNGVAAGCEQSFPDERVDAELQKPQYTGCVLDVMLADYAALLVKQERLLAIFEPEYGRHLNSQGFTGAEVEARRAEFAGKRRILVAEARSLASVPGAETVDPTPRSRERLRASNQASRSLASRLVFVGAGGDVDEPLVCKIDFHFRVLEGLHNRLHACLPANEP